MVIFSFSIHLDTISKRRPLIVTPNNGSTFGWRRLFHTMTSLKKPYTVVISTPFALLECIEWLLTRLILLRSLNCDTFRTFTATLIL